MVLLNLFLFFLAEFRDKSLKAVSKRTEVKGHITGLGQSALSFSFPLKSGWYLNDGIPSTRLLEISPMLPLGNSSNTGFRDVAQLVQLRTDTPLTQVRVPGAKGDFFSPRVNFRCRLSYGVRTPPCAIACIYICAHVKDLVVHVRVRWIVETLKHSACTVGRSLLFPGK